MPIDAHGNYLSGVSGSGVWRNGELQQPAPSGWPQFWPTGYIFNIRFSEGPPELWNIETEGGMVLSVQGAAPLYAGGGVWLAALLGGSPCSRSSWGLALPAMPLGVAPSGRLFTTIGPYPNNAYGIAGYDPDNYTPVVSIGPASVMPGPANFFALDDIRYIWLTGGLTLASYGFSSQPAVVKEGLQIASAPMLVEVSGAVWSAYVTQSGRGVCHPYADASKGFVAPPNAFGFGVWSPAVGVLELCWTGNLGQTGPVYRQRFNVADAYPLEPVTPEPPIEPPVPPHPEPPNPIPPEPPNPEPGPDPQPPIQPTEENDMTGFGELISGVTPATSVPHPTSPGKYLIKTLDGQNVGVNSDGKIYYSGDPGADQTWEKGNKCMVNVNTFSGTQYFFLEWFD